jgi:hypothetical protein
MADHDFRADVYQIKQLISVLVADSHATMASGCPIGSYLIAHSRSAIEFCR